MIKRIIFSLTILTSIIACSEEVQKPIDPGSPPEFPHVFMGNAYVNGDPIKQGITIYAKFGESYSQEGETISGGRYVNVLVAPKSSKETQEIVTFYMKTENGEEKAKETFKLKKVPEPEIVNLALNFNSYP